VDEGQVRRSDPDRRFGRRKSFTDDRFCPFSRLTGTFHHGAEPDPRRDPGISIARPIGGSAIAAIGHAFFSPTQPAGHDDIRVL
jgi:hypothetical protein